MSTALPRATPSLRAGLRQEASRLLRPPLEDLSTLLVNALLVCGGWLLLPPAAQAWLFSLHGPLAFALVLESWMLADTTATNMLANDPGGSLAALPDPARLRRLLRVKTIALAVAVGPVCATVCIAVAIAVGRLAAGLALAATLLALPFGTVAVAAWLGVLLPYHRHRLAWRWLHRRPWRRTLRWGVLVVAPYTVVPALTATLLAPGLLVGVDLRHRDGHAYLAGRSVVAAAALGCLAAAIAFWLGPYVAARLAARRGAALAAYLRDPERG